MSWLKENWLDVLIFVLLTAVVVAIVFFLIGINPFAKPPQVVSAPPPSPAPEAEAEAEVPKPPPEREAEPITVLPLPPASEEAAPEAVPTPSTPEAGATAAPQRPSPAASASGRFRVAVGSFTRPSFAAKLAKKLEAEGYPVRVEVVGKVSRVVVGPFADRAEAERVAERLASYEPLIYRGDTPVPAGTYLQVAAFKDLDHAAELARTLKEKGYDVVLYYRDGWAKVWVGPLADEALPEIKEKLKAEGFEPVEVRGG